MTNEAEHCIEKVDLSNDVTAENNHMCTDLFRAEFATRFVNVFDLDVWLVVILFFKILSEASVFLPPAVLVINIPWVERTEN